nr:uncharacterized protein LOC109154689 [Ipomoea trifida]
MEAGILRDRSLGECDPQLPPANGKRKSVFKRIGKIESQRSVFDRLGSNPQAPKRKSIHERLGVVQDVKNNASHPVEAEPSKRPRSMIPSRMIRETDIHISCGEVLKVQPRTIVHTRVHKGENEESVGSSDDVAPPQGEEASSFHITLCDETPIEGEDAEEAPHELEKGVRAALDELKEVDLGTPENPRPIFISTLLSNEDEKIYVELLKEYIDVFAWTYKEMPGLDPKVAVHRLAVKKTCCPVKQAQRRFRPKLIPSIEGEVNKLIEAGFIREVKYPTWISSIVPEVSLWQQLSPRNDDRRHASSDFPHLPDFVCGDGSGHDNGDSDSSIIGGNGLNHANGAAPTPGLSSSLDSMVQQQRRSSPPLFPASRVRVS